MSSNADSVAMASQLEIEEDLLDGLPLKNGDEVIAEVHLANGQTGTIRGIFHDRTTAISIMASSNRDEPGEMHVGSSQGVVRVADKSCFDCLAPEHIESKLGGLIVAPIKKIRRTEEAERSVRENARAKLIAQRMAEQSQVLQA